MSDQKENINKKKTGKHITVGTFPEAQTETF